MPERGQEYLSPLGRAFLGGLMKHAGACTPFATPTVNGYRRYRPNSLAPDRATWCHDHRGVMIRVLGGRGDPATRLENRAGEPAANPYLYMTSQIIAGLAGIDAAIDPGPASDEPYASDRPLLPGSLMEALDALEQDAVFRNQLGGVFVDYFLKLKRNETGRFQRWLDDHAIRPQDDETTAWEQNEYFDFF
jgi:glutamine synthetase